MRDRISRARSSARREEAAIGSLEKVDALLRGGASP
jgi:hypothetical protein